MFIEAKVDGSGGDNWSYKSCKAPVKSSPSTNQLPVFLQAGCPSCRPTNNVKALKGKYHIPWTCLLQAHLGIFQLCLWLLIAPGYLGEGYHASHQPSDTSTPCHWQCVIYKWHTAFILLLYIKTFFVTDSVSFINVFIIIVIIIIIIWMVWHGLCILSACKV